MYEYEFETATFTGFGTFELQDYREIIADRAAAGWRFVSFVPIKQNANGWLKQVDLVFERELK